MLHRYWTPQLVQPCLAYLLSHSVAMVTWFLYISLPPAHFCLCPWPGFHWPNANMYAGAVVRSLLLIDSFSDKCYLRLCKWNPKSNWVNCRLDVVCDCYRKYKLLRPVCIHVPQKCVFRGKLRRLFKQICANIKTWYIEMQINHMAKTHSWQSLKFWHVFTVAGGLIAFVCIQ